MLIQLLFIPGDARSLVRSRQTERFASVHWSTARGHRSHAWTRGTSLIRRVSADDCHIGLPVPRSAPPDSSVLKHSHTSDSVSQLKFPRHDRNYSAIHLRCNNYCDVTFSRLLPYTDSFQSPFSSVHALNTSKFPISYFFPYLISVLQFNNQTSGLKHCYNTTISQRGGYTPFFPDHQQNFLWFSLIFHISGNPFPVQWK